MSASWTFPNGEVVAVNAPYYPASCDKCGWQGSSEACGTDVGFDDSDVYCPSCHASGADCGKAGEAATPTTPPDGEGRHD